MIIIVAPYSPIGLSECPHLGASRKIEVVIRALSELDKNIVLLNTAHNNCNSDEEVYDIDISGVAVQTYTLRRYSSRKVGKLFNLKDVFSAVNKCIELGVPKLVWLYNGYAFENLFSLVIKRKVKVPVVLEFEDWHFSRSGGGNPKPYIDYLFWKLNLKNIDFAFGVNDNLVNILAKNGVKGAVLPGVVPVQLVESCERKDIFAKEVVRVGYFGGLSKEKGVDVVIDIINRLPGSYKVVVSGSGVLDKDLTELSIKYPKQLEFHGLVSESKLYELIASVDVILNPHSPISDMSQGVFPFKVIEAIASGRLLITTELPPANVPGLLDGAVFYDGSSDELLQCISGSRVAYKNLRKKITKSAMISRNSFSLSALLRPVKKIMNVSG